MSVVNDKSCFEEAASENYIMKRWLSLICIAMLLGALGTTSQARACCGNPEPTVANYYGPAPTYQSSSITGDMSGITATNYAPIAPVTTYYAPAPVTAYYAPAPVTTYYAPAPVTTYYAPAPVTAYYAPAPVTSYYAPVTSYYAPTTAYYAPAVVASPYYVRAKVYVRGEPVRNFFRAATPY